MKTTLHFIKLSTFAMMFLLATAASAFIIQQPVAAACPPGTTTTSGGLCQCPDGFQLVSVPVDDGTHCVAINKDSAALTDNPIFFYLRNFLVFLAGGVGLAVVGGIVAGSYMYTTARANVAQTQRGQDMIINSVIGLLLFIFMYAILQFIIPGGVFQ